ncbi:MAG: hypothetical protein ACLUFV_00600 [Acutalibacteraceae bacterium]
MARLERFSGRRRRASSSPTRTASTPASCPCWTKDNDFFSCAPGRRADARAAVSLCRDRLPKATASPRGRHSNHLAHAQGRAGHVRAEPASAAGAQPARREKAREKYGAVVFREGDKIMQTRNNYDVEWHKDGTQGSGVFNGDMGRILKIAPGGERMTLSFDGRIAEYDARCSRTSSTPTPSPSTKARAASTRWCSSRCSPARIR